VVACTNSPSIPFLERGRKESKASASQVRPVVLESSADAPADDGEVLAAPLRDGSLPPIQGQGSKPRFPTSLPPLQVPGASGEPVDERANVVAHTRIISPPLARKGADLPKGVAKPDHIPDIGASVPMPDSPPAAAREGEEAPPQVAKQGWSPDHASEESGAQGATSDPGTQQGGTSMGTCLCGKPAMFDCTRCGTKSYCSFSCQRDDWKEHRAECKKKDAPARRLSTTGNNRVAPLSSPIQPATIAVPVLAGSGGSGSGNASPSRPLLPISPLQSPLQVPQRPGQMPQRPAFMSPPRVVAFSPRMNAELAEEERQTDV
jgi:hypothetical protein